MSGTNLKASHAQTITDCTAVRVTQPFQVYPYDYATATVQYTNGGAGDPELKLQGSNNPLAAATPGAVEWSDLVTIAAITDGDSVSNDLFNRRFLWYRFRSDAAGHAGDVLLINLYFSRPR